MELNVKKCPFCNGNAELYSVKGKLGYFCFVKCSFCGSQGKTYSMGETRNNNWDNTLAANNAISAWNKRAGDADAK